MNKEEIEVDLKLRIADMINDFFVDKIRNIKDYPNKNSYLREVSEFIQLRDEIIEKWGDNLK